MLNGEVTTNIIEANGTVSSSVSGINGVANTDSISVSGVASSDGVTVEGSISLSTVQVVGGATSSDVSVSGGVNTVTTEINGEVVIGDKVIEVASKEWEYYACNIHYTLPIPLSSDASGDILVGNLGNEVIYRYISSGKDDTGYPLEDSFYSDLELTQKITTRGN